MAVITRALKAAAMAVCLGATSTAAEAATFANFGQTNTLGKEGVVWRKGTPATNASLFTDSQAFSLGGMPVGPNALGPTAVTQPANRDSIATWITFSLLGPEYASLQSSLFIYATEAGHAATCSSPACGLGSFVMQSGIDGNATGAATAAGAFQGMRFVYTGATNNALGLLNGMTLLDVHFTDAMLTGMRTSGAGSANLSDSTVMGQSIVTYTSDLLNGLGGRPDISQAFDGNFGLGFSNVRNSLGFNSGAAIPSFAANVSGTFAAELQLSVPEPGTWALMILGFGAAGAALRRRAVAA